MLAWIVLQLSYLNMAVGNSWEREKAATGKSRELSLVKARDRAFLSDGGKVSLHFSRDRTSSKRDPVKRLYSLGHFAWYGRLELVGFCRMIMRHTNASRYQPSFAVILVPEIEDG
jgi:hypothetical protein